MPAEQSSHAVAPVASCHSPAAHGVHSDCFLLAANVPAAHGVWSVDPVAQNEPCGQSVHWPADSRLAAFE